MRSITNVTIRKDCEKKQNAYTVFLEYNSNANDYSFNVYNTFDAALQSIPLNSGYFPLKVSEYRLLVMKGNKTFFDETIKF